MTGKSAIQQYYKDQVIFITGGTGFVGKVLVEKLLRTCDLRKIYLLVRPKKNKTPAERLQDLFTLPCFDWLNSEGTEYRSKVQLINGDCAKPNLGLIEKDIKLIIQEVTVMIHAAANVKFNQPLRQAATYLICTMDILKLAKTMSKLKGFVYVSTAFSNCIYTHIKEEFYEPPMTGENFLKLISSVDDDVLEVVVPKILKSWPNTYVYTKSIIEDYIKRMGKGLPITIVRPAIVVNSNSEPVPGWIDNFYGVLGIAIGTALGVIKSIHAKLHVVMEIVPVDYVANQILAAAWAIGKNNANVTIYNYTTSKMNPITTKRYKETMTRHMNAVGLTKQLLPITCQYTESKFWHDVKIFFLHTCFAYFVDFILFCIGREPIAVKNYQRINQQLNLISYFVTRNWNFDDGNVRNLWMTMSQEDKELYNFDMESLDWDKWMEKAAIGTRIYLMKDPLETVPQAVRKQKILLVIHYIVVTVFWYLIYKFIIVLSPMLM